MSFVAVFGITVLGVGGSLLQTHRKAAALSRLSWDDLLGKLKPVGADGINTIALDYLQPGKGQTRIETDELWELIGGFEGIRRIRANADVLLALAGFAQRWNPAESVIVAERMRRDGIALRRAALKLLVSLPLGFGKTLGPFNVQQAASSYYLMRQRLLALYETSHAGRYPELAAIL
jgi:hypothetical protein